MGRELLKAAWGHDPMMSIGSGLNQGNELDHPRRRHNLEEAIRAFETVLLLDHTNRPARSFFGRLSSGLDHWEVG